MQRLQMRESCIERQGFKTDRKTLTKVVQARKEKNIQENMEKFSKQTLGIHGHELPKYSKQLSKWWQKRKNYKETPHYGSLA